VCKSKSEREREKINYDDILDDDIMMMMMMMMNDD